MYVYARADVIAVEAAALQCCSAMRDTLIRWYHATPGLALQHKRPACLCAHSPTAPQHQPNPPSPTQPGPTQPTAGASVPGSPATASPRDARSQLAAPAHSRLSRAIAPASGASQPLLPAAASGDSRGSTIRPRARSGRKGATVAHSARTSSCCRVFLGGWGVVVASGLVGLV